MTDRSVVHDTFVIEREYNAAPARVFTAFADPAAKAKWFGGPGSTALDLDFRVGGREYNAGGPPGGAVFTFEAIYRDIVADQRIVTTYEMTMDGRRISVSVATVEFLPSGDGTRLVFTEQGVYLDGLDTPAARLHGSRELLEALGRELDGEPAIS